jgi:ferredoxin
MVRTSPPGCPCVPSVVWIGVRPMHAWSSGFRAAALREIGISLSSLIFHLCFGGGSCGGCGVVLPERGMVKCLDESLNKLWWSS